MQKREAGKSGGFFTTPAKRGRPFGSTAAAAAAAAATSAAAAAAGDVSSPASLLGPSLQITTSLADQNNKRIVLALQSGLKSELTWALNTLTLLSFKERDDLRRDSTALAKIPGLLDALLQIVDDWRDIALPRDYTKPARVRTLGANLAVTGFGNELTSSLDTTSYPGHKKSSNLEVSSGKRHRSIDWWFEDDGLFNLDEEAHAEKQQCAVAASNVIRNFSFMPDNEMIMAQHRHCMETMFQCIEDQNTEDEELITNALETIANLAPLLDLRIFSSSKPSYIGMTEKRAVQAIMGMLGSSVKAWHCAAAELLGRLIINPDNEPFLLPSTPEIYKRLVDLLSLPAVDAQAAAVGALYNLAEVHTDSRLKLASERWAVDRLFKVIKTPHPVPDVCRKAAMILESLVSDPQNRHLLMAHESSFAEMLMSDARYSDTFSRLLYELTSRPNKVTAARGVWGMIDWIFTSHVSWESSASTMSSFYYIGCPTTSLLSSASGQESKRTGTETLPVKGEERMGIAISVLGKLGLPGMDSLSTDQVYKKYFGSKNIRNYKDFHRAFVDLCSDFNLVMPGKHFTIQATEIEKFYEKWPKGTADPETDIKRKALLVEFMKEQVEEYKTSSRAMMFTGVTAAPAAILIKKSGEKVPQLKMLRIDLIPNVVFVPAFTVLSLIGVRILNVTKTTRATH